MKAITTHGGMGGYHCTGSKGHEWATSYCSLIPASQEQNKRGVKGFNYDGIPIFDTENHNYHDYTVINSCSKSLSWCTKNKIYQRLKMFPAPLASGKTIIDEELS